MVFNTYTNGDPRSFFYYKGDYYINGTEIILTDEYIKRQLRNGKKLWKYATYHHQVSRNNGIAYFFCRSRCDWLALHGMGVDPKVIDDCEAYFTIDALDIDSEIKEFIHQIKLKRDETDAIKDAIIRQQSDFDHPNVMLLWVVYISVMIGSLIFKQFYILWAVASILFFKWRRDMLDK